MIGHELREFVDRVMDRLVIDVEDVNCLRCDILGDAVVTRDVIDVLVALDRAVPQRCEAYGDYLTALVIDFAVWQNRPTGVVDRDKAHWLVTTLSAGEGPTATARRIAFEIVREAERCDEALIGFALDKGHGQPARARHERMLLAS